MAVTGSMIVTPSDPPMAPSVTPDGHGTDVPAAVIFVTVLEDGDPAPDGTSFWMFGRRKASLDPTWPGWTQLGFGEKEVNRGAFGVPGGWGERHTMTASGTDPYYEQEYRACTANDAATYFAEGSCSFLRDGGTRSNFAPSIPVMSGAGGFGGISLEWTPSVGVLDPELKLWFYILRRYPAPTGGGTQIAVEITDTDWLDTGATPGTPYWYGVRAFTNFPTEDDPFFWYSESTRIGPFTAGTASVSLDGIYIPLTA